MIKRIKNQIIITKRKIRYEKYKHLKETNIYDSLFPTTLYNRKGFVLFASKYLTNLSSNSQKKNFPIIFCSDLSMVFGQMNFPLWVIYKKPLLFINSDKFGKMPLFEIKNLTACINDLIILKNFNLKIYHGEIHVIMGRNGSGKSTLSKVISGHPAYKILTGDMLFEGNSILNLEPEERSHLGIFLAFQYPVEIPGVSNEDFLRLAYNAKLKNENKLNVNPIKFLEIISERLKIVQMDSAFLARNINEGFSGGEKKRNEILQMALLDPQLSILDETDSGLDIDALKIVAKGINYLMNKNKSMILITHYQRLLDYVKPDYIHIIQNGTIIKTGNANLAIELETNGYGTKNQ